MIASKAVAKNASYQSVFLSRAAIVSFLAQSVMGTGTSGVLLPTDAAAGALSIGKKFCAPVF